MVKQLSSEANGQNVKINTLLKKTTSHFGTLKKKEVNLKAVKTGIKEDKRRFDMLPKEPIELKSSNSLKSFTNLKDEQEIEKHWKFADRKKRQDAMYEHQGFGIHIKAETAEDIEAREKEKQRQIQLFKDKLGKDDAEFEFDPEIPAM